MLFISELSSACEKLERLMWEFTLKMIYNKLKTSALLCEIIADIIRKTKSVSSASSMYLSDKIINYIHENYSHSITNKLMGDRFGYHPNYISSIIKQRRDCPSTNIF